MNTRRAGRWWFFAAVGVLPAWLLLGYGIFGGSSGWTVLGLLIVAPILALALLVVALLLAFRPSLTPDRRLRGSDLALVGAWHLSIIALGFFPPAAWAVGLLAVALGLASIWLFGLRFLAGSKLVVEQFAGASVPVQGPVGFGQQPAAEADPGYSYPPARESFDPEKPQDGQTFRLG